MNTTTDTTRCTCTPIIVDGQLIDIPLCDSCEEQRWNEDNAKPEYYGLLAHAAFYTVILIIGLGFWYGVVKLIDLIPGQLG